MKDKQNNPVSVMDRAPGLVKRDASGNVLHHMVHSHQWRHTFVHNHLKTGTPIERPVHRLKRLPHSIGDTVKVGAATYAHFIEERQAMLDKHTEATWS
jgi:hypothetical protein